MKSWFWKTALEVARVVVAALAGLLAGGCALIF